MKAKIKKIFLPLFLIFSTLVVSSYPLSQETNFQNSNEFFEERFDGPDNTWKSGIDILDEFKIVEYSYDNRTDFFNIKGTLTPSQLYWDTHEGNLYNFWYHFYLIPENLMDSVENYSDYSKLVSNSINFYDTFEHDDFYVKFNDGPYTYTFETMAVQFVPGENSFEINWPLDMESVKCLSKNYQLTLEWYYDDYDLVESRDYQTMVADTKIENPYFDIDHAETLTPGIEVVDTTDPIIPDEANKLTWLWITIGIVGALVIIGIIIFVIIL